jgi:hypothetical protein
VPARRIGKGKLQPIEDAPGSYVRVKGRSGAPIRSLSSISP